MAGLVDVVRGALDLAAKAAEGSGSVVGAAQANTLKLQIQRIFYKGEQPVGGALWALVDELVAKRIDGGDKRLTAVEWKSGSNMRIIDIIAPFGGEAEMQRLVGSR
jgi:hemolysin-activating ACP:hemolysin acyltransferase